MKRALIASLAAGAALLGTGAAHAGNVHWSVGISVPPVATVISNGPGWVGAPAYSYYPAPVAYAPPPVIYEEPEVVYPAYGYRPARPIVYAPRYVGRPYYGPRHDWYGARDARWAPPGHRRHHER